MAIMGYVAVFAAMLCMAMLGGYTALCVFDYRKSKDARRPRVKEVGDTVGRAQFVPDTGYVPLDERTVEPDDGELLAKIDKSASLTEASCDGEGVNTGEYIRSRMRKQDAKFGQKKRKQG